MEFSLRIRTSGAVDGQALSESASEVAVSHFRFVSTVAQTKRGFVWDRRPVGPVNVFSHDWGQIPAQFCESISLDDEPGVRLFLGHQPDPDGSDRQGEMWFRFHHVCCDGLGAVAYVSQVLERYLRRMGLTNEPHRHSVKTTAHTGRRHRLTEIQRTFRYFSNQPIQMRCRDGNPSPGRASSVVTCHLPQVIHCPLRDRMAANWNRPPFSLNDLVLHCLFRAIAKWTLDRGMASQGWVRIGVPINLREDSSKSCAEISNDVGMVFLDRRIEDQEDSEQLMGIHNEMRTIKTRNCGHAMTDVIRWLAPIPGGLKILTQGDRHTTTAVLSNLGVVDWPRPHDGHGGSFVESVAFYPPVREGTALACGVFTQGQTLRVGCNYDSDAMSELDARFFMALLTDELSQQRDFWTKATFE
ncbi:MAG: hypothetical protein KDA80_13585 [Planctomycetaceae bacterium]|nr:hypothetical protein [Planctomycetaceae bacterium]